MAGIKGYSFDTQSLHIGQTPDAVSGALATPLHLSTAYALPDCDTATARFNLEVPGHIDSSLSNPTVAVLEERIAALEGGVGAIATASGPAALFLAISTLMGAGAHIVAQCGFSSASRDLLQHTLPRFGIETTLIDAHSPDAADACTAAIRPNTRLVFGEAFSSLSLNVFDIPRMADIAHAHGLPLLVDTTLATPYLLRAFEHGADLVMHSAGEFLSGHGTAVGGLIVDSGRFDWEGKGAHVGYFPTLSEPFAGLSGIDFAEESPVAAFLLRARYEGLRNCGACMAPMAAFQILQGIDTLSLRMTRHVENTQKIVDFLASQRAVTRIFHPAHPQHPDQALAARLYLRGSCAVLAFEIQGGQRSAVRFIESLRLFTHAAHVGEAKSLAIHPASATHATKTCAGIAGVTPATIRLSIGLEDADDLLEDLARALARAFPC